MVVHGGLVGNDPCLHFLSRALRRRRRAGASGAVGLSGDCGGFGRPRLSAPSAFSQKRAVTEARSPEPAAGLS